MNAAAALAIMQEPRPLIAHVVYRFDVGGLENGIVNLINGLPPEPYRHAIVSLTEITDFRARIVRDDIQFIALKKKPGHGFALYPRLVRLFRSLGPTIVHTRNLAALEATVPAWLAGVPVRVHGEHGRDMNDVDGSSRVYRWIRRVYAPFVNRYVAVSKDLEQYLCGAVGVRPDRVSQIYNGVDLARFAPASGARVPIEGCPFVDPDLWLVGTLGRMQAVKDQVTLARAFVRAIRSDSTARRLRLVIVGDGPLKVEVERELAAAGLRQLAWLPGERSDTAALLRSLDTFVLPSRAEGISNTILEAMASAVPVVATRVGGNVELVVDGLTGRLVPPADSAAMASAMLEYFFDPKTARQHGRAARQAAVQRFSLDRMIRDYLLLYDSVVSYRSARSHVGAGG